MLGEVDRSDTAGMILGSWLDRHEQRRQASVPTISVLTGPINLAAHFLDRWCKLRGRTLVLLETEPRDPKRVVTAWVDRLAARCDLVDASAAWLSTQLREDRGAFTASIHAKTPFELALFLEGALPGCSLTAVEVVCRRILSEAAEGLHGARHRKGLAARLNTLLEAFPHPWTRVLAALAELVPSSAQPVLALIGHVSSCEPEGDPGLAATARLLSEIASSQPRLTLTLVLEQDALQAYLESAPESRALAQLRESIIPLTAATSQDLPAGSPG